MMNTVKRFWALCLDTHMKLALYKYAIIIIIIYILEQEAKEFTIKYHYWLATLRKYQNGLEYKVRCVYNAGFVQPRSKPVHALGTGCIQPGLLVIMAIGRQELVI